MRIMELATGFAILSGTLAFAASSANAAELVNISTCTNMQQQVRAALDTNPQSPNHEAAVREQRFGVEFCSQGFYQNGVAHYEEAIRLLNGQKSAQQS